MALFEKDGVRFEVIGDIQAAAFRDSGFTEVAEPEPETETEPENPKRRGRPRKTEAATE